MNALNLALLPQPASCRLLDGWSTGNWWVTGWMEQSSLYSAAMSAQIE